MESTTIINNPDKLEHIVSKDWQLWKLNGKPHREDGPAILSSNGDKEYYKYGKVHNDKGPAIITHSCVLTQFSGAVIIKSYRWFLEGNELSDKQWREQTGNQYFMELLIYKLKKIFKKK